MKMQQQILQPAFCGPQFSLITNYAFLWGIFSAEVLLRVAKYSFIYMKQLLLYFDQLKDVLTNTV